jgi:hypothetical protein
VPVFENRSVLEIARGIKAFLNVEVGVIRNPTQEPGSSPDAPKALGASGRTSSQVRRFERAGQRMVKKGRALGIRARRWLQVGAEGGSIRPENIVWIYGAGRTGSTWLSRMMGELGGHTVWFEPWVGALFDPYHLRLEERKGKHFILSPRYRSTWLRSIRNFVLDGAGARFPEVAKDRYLVIKEPGGSVGAGLLMEALPESRMILLVRDPRDVVASWVDARREGGWRDEGRKEKNLPPVQEEKNVSPVPIDKRAKRYLQNVGEAKKAYELHEGRKILVKYEELRADALGTMRRIYSALEIPVAEEELKRAVEKHAWENIPEEEKGEGKFYRKATPGGWRDDLSPEQVRAVERITAPLLNELYPS